MTISLPGAMYLLSFLCGLMYLGLGVAAYRNVSSQSRHDMFGAASPWWAFYDDVYDETGKRLCRWGKLSFVAAMLSVGAGYLVEQTIA